MYIVDILWRNLYLIHIAVLKDTATMKEKMHNIFQIYICRDSLHHQCCLLLFCFVFYRHLFITSYLFLVNYYVIMLFL